jgi:hypothetical protein
MESIVAGPGDVGVTLDRYVGIQLQAFKRRTKSEFLLDIVTMFG